MCPSYPTCPLWDKCDSPMQEQSYGILPIPSTHPIQCVHPIPPVPCRTSRTVLWNVICPTNTLNPMCPSYPTTVLWNPVCPTNTLNPMCVPSRTSWKILSSPICSISGGGSLYKLGGGGGGQQSEHNFIYI